MTPSRTDPVAAALEAAGRVPDAAVVAALLGTAALAVVVLGRAALQTTGGPRRAWALVAVTCAGWGVGHASVFLGAPMWVLWGITRPVTLVTLFLGILAFPGVRRPLRDLGVAAVDGWMTMGGVFVVAWMALHGPRADLHTVTSLVPWAVADQITLSVIAGLLSLAAPGHRAPIVYVLVAGTLPGVGDVVWAFSGDATFGALSWALAILLIGLVPVLSDGAIFSTAFLDPSRRRVVRLYQTPILPAAFVLLGPYALDTVSKVLALSVLLVTFVNVAVSSQQNAKLLETVSRQSTRYRELLTDSRDAIFQLDDAGRVEFGNAAVEPVLGHAPSRLIGRPWTELVHPADARRVEAELTAVGPDRLDPVRIEARLRHADGRTVHTESSVSRRSEAGGWVLSTRDVTDRVRLRDELAQQARTDPLTGLLNRAAFLDLVDGRLEAGRTAVVMFIDLDGFKAVNDTLGHSAGDVLLRQVSGRLHAAVGPDDAVARLGGDEFAVLVSSGEVDVARFVATRLITALHALEQPVRGARTSASVGIAAARRGPAAELLRDADLAMYRAKATGGGTALVFEPWMSEEVLERSRLRGRLEAAIEEGGLFLEHQPVVDLGTGGWTGFEALVRWQEGARRRGPGEFLPLAEETGLIVPLGTWVLGEALQQLAAWPDPAAGVAVNVSPAQLEAPDFARIVTRSLERSGVRPDRLTLEITEQTAVEDLGRTASRLAPLREAGVHVAIDDFGTGFSSMRYLTRLPVDALKIDQQFVAGMGVRPEDAVLVQSMIRLAEDLGLEVIAEGVETEAQADLLRAQGCRLAQGYLFSRPRPIGELRAAIPATARA